MDGLCQSLREALAQAGPAGLAAACVLALGELRGVDARGGAALLAACLWPAADPALEDLARQLEDLAQRQACLGCGTCCRVSSPTLYAQDLALIGPEGLPRAALYALRAGERVRSARLGQSLILNRDLIKLREALGDGCQFLRGSRCGLYNHRPLQCRHLECWSGRHAGQLEGQPRLGRRDLFADDATALALLEEYEQRLPGAALAQALEMAAAGGGQDQALALMELDNRLRAGISVRYGYPLAELDLLLGRPARAVALAHGLELALDSQGRPCLRQPFSPV